MVSRGTDSRGKFRETYLQQEFKKWKNCSNQDTTGKPCFLWPAEEHIPAAGPSSFSTALSIESVTQSATSSFKEVIERAWCWQFKEIQWLLINRSTWHWNGLHWWFLWILSEIQVNERTASLLIFTWIIKPKTCGKK